MRRLLALAILALGLAATPALAQDAAREGVLELAVDQAPVGLDPHLVTAFSSFAVIGQIYDGLLEANDELGLEPALAESWEVSEDGLEVTVRLRAGVVFHNGRALTAEDVVYSLERILAEATGSPLASRFSQVAAAEAVDGLTVRFTLSEPFAPFLANLTNLYVVPREVVEEHGDLQQVAVGTGPFVLDEVVPDTEVRLVANGAYYREGQPRLAGLRYHVVPEASTRAAGLRSGQYHLLPAVDPATAETLRRAGGVELLATQDLAYSLLGLNVARAPLDDPAARAALNRAIDRDEIVEAVYFGNAVPGGPLSPALRAWALEPGDFACYAGDGDAAALAEAGLDGAGLELLTFGTIKEVSDLAQVLQAQLSEAGLGAEVDLEEFGSFVQRWRNSEFDAFVSLNGGNLDPDGYLYRTFHTDGSTNVFGYSDPEVDRLLEAGRRETDEAARKEIYDELQRTLACEGPIVHIAYGTLFTAVRDEVEGFRQMPTRELTYLRETSLR